MTPAHANAAPGLFKRAGLAIESLEDEIHCRIMLITAIVRPFLAAAALVAPIRSCSSYRRKAAISNIGSRAPANHMSVSLKRVISIGPRDLQRCPITWSKQT